MNKLNHQAPITFRSVGQVSNLRADVPSALSGYR
jgi:hypothetical protein